MYRLTGDRKYQDWGWEIYQAILKHCKVDAGFAGIRYFRVIGALVVVDGKSGGGDSNLLLLQGCHQRKFGSRRPYARMHTFHRIALSHNTHRSISVIFLG